MNEQEEFEFRLRLEREQTTKPPQKGGADRFGTLSNMAAGAVRGAGSIGATLLSPIDAAARALNGGKPVSVGGYDIVGQDRRAGMDAGLSELGANTDSLAFKGGKLAGEIAGTAGMGGAIANGARLLPMAGRMAPGIDALRTAGMSAGGMTGMGGLATRAAGGAVTGGASAALVSPDDVGAGAVIGAVMPGALQLAGKAGSAVGRTIRGPEQSAGIADAIKAAQAAGYVIPPTQANPTLMNRLLEGAAGKLTTAQNASARNQGVTNKLAAEALGLAPDAKLSPELLQGIRKQAGQAYDAIGQTGVVTPGAGYAQSLDDIAAPFLKTAKAFPNAKPSPVLDLVESLKTTSFDAGSAVEKIKQLRTAADDAFRTGNTDIGRASKAAAGTLEDALEQHLQQIGQPDALQAFREARKLIAKTYTVEKALNPTSGSVDARKLAGQVNKGKPLSGELRQAADFANQFPKASQAIEGMGSLPQWSPLDLYGGMGISGIGGAVTGSPLAALGLTLPIVRAGSRSAVLSPMVQRRLLQSQKPSLLGLLGDERITRAGLLSAPILATDQ